MSCGREQPAGGASRHCSSSELAAPPGTALGPAVGRWRHVEAAARRQCIRGAGTSPVSAAAEHGAPACPAAGCRAARLAPPRAACRMRMCSMCAACTAGGLQRAAGLPRLLRPWRAFFPGEKSPLSDTPQPRRRPCPPSLALFTDRSCASTCSRLAPPRTAGTVAAGSRHIPRPHARPQAQAVTHLHPIHRSARRFSRSLSQSPCCPPTP